MCSTTTLLYELSLAGASFERVYPIADSTPICSSVRPYSVVSPLHNGRWSTLSCSRSAWRRTTYTAGERSAATCWVPLVRSFYLHTGHSSASRCSLVSPKLAAWRHPGRASFLAALPRATATRQDSLPSSGATPRAARYPPAGLLSPRQDSHDELP